MSLVILLGDESGGPDDKIDCFSPPGSESVLCFLIPSSHFPCCQPSNRIFVSLCGRGGHVYVFACLSKIISIDLNALRLMMTPGEIISNTVQGFKLSSLADYLRLGDSH